MGREWGRCRVCGGPARGDYCSGDCSEKVTNPARTPDPGRPAHGHRMTVVFTDDPASRSEWWRWVCAKPGCGLETDNPLEPDDLEPACEGERIYDG